MRRALALVLLLVASATQGEELTSGHQAQLLTSGKASFAQRYKNIKDADVVLLKTYAFLDDATGHSMVEALRQRALAGKQVFVEYDVKGTSHGGPLGLLGNAIGFGRALPAYLQPLVEAGATLIPTNMPKVGSMLFGRDHDKLLVTWKEGEPVKVVMGGMNVGNHYAWAGNWGRFHPKPERGFRDTDVELIGPEAARVMERFVEAAGRAKPGNAAMGKLEHALAGVANAPTAFAPRQGPHGADVRFYSNDPKRGNSRTIEKLYERLIAETPAGETITLTNAYTLLTARAQKAVITASQRGVKFHFVVNSPQGGEAEARSLGYAFRDQLRSFLKRVPPGTVKVTEFAGNARRNESIVHQKLAKFGSNGPVVVGSHNLDNISANYNSEAVAVIRGHRVSQQFDALVNRMQREGRTRKIDLATLKHDSFAVKARGFVMHRIFGKML